MEADGVDDIVSSEGREIVLNRRNTIELKVVAKIELRINKWSNMEEVL